MIDELSVASYFFTIAWFLSYQREKISLNPEDHDLNYGSVGAALSEVNFVLIIRYFRDSFTLRRWNSLHVAMVCFRELLQISNSIFGKKKKASDFENEDEMSQHEIDRELGEGIIRKLFSFRDFMNIIIQIPQSAAKHSPDYLRVSVSVVHIILKAFESFANENIQLYIQSKRKRNKKNQKRINDLDKSTEDRLRDVIYASDEEMDEASAKEIAQERKLDFNKTESRFFHQAIVTTYIKYLSRFEDLSDHEIKICLSYFHRLFVVRKDYTGLYRLDFMQVLHRLRNYLQRGSSIRLQVEEFIYYFMKKFKLAIERFPLPIELLFPRFEDAETRLYLATGELYEKPELESTSRAPRLAKELEFVRDFGLDEKVKILISQLHIQEKQPLINWIISELERIINDRILDPEAVIELNGSNQFRRLIINNGYLRLLLRLIGFDLPYTTEENPELPTTVEMEHLTKIIELIKKWNSNQPVIFEDNKAPSFFLRTRESGFDEDQEDVEYDGRYNPDDESIAFETEANPNSKNFAVSQLDKLDELERQLLLLLQKHKDHRSESDGVRGQARKKKRSKDDSHKKAKKKPHDPTNVRRRRIPKDLLEDDSQVIKSAEFINDSDDESDDEKDKEFFEREERMRKLVDDIGGIATPAQLLEIQKLWKNFEANGGDKTAVSVAKAVKEVGLFVTGSDDEEEEQQQDSQPVLSQASQPSQSPALEEEEEEEEEEGHVSDHTSDTSELESEVETSKRKLDDIADEEEEQEVSHTHSKRKRMVISDDDEDE
ncbi:Topoisomerase 1-associated factor 1 [Candida viswanathii]|uniref:Topoisomerase 1-associated factor 1 n=1 Tax=Candida viswanathii TaxID=5486 RepID=A0A367YIX9_9ASCO|nr:Topoisomerase 1-associated factor 1 [Candida viswanathii]